MPQERSAARYRSLIKRWESTCNFRLRSETVGELEAALKHRYPEYAAITTFDSSEHITIVMQKGRNGVRLDFFLNKNPVVFHVSPFIQYWMRPSQTALLSIILVTVVTVCVSLIRIPFWFGLVLPLWLSVLIMMAYGCFEGFYARRDGSFPDDEEILNVAEFSDRFIKSSHSH